MKKKLNPFIVNGFQTEGLCRDNSYYVRFTDEDIDDLARYAYDLGYSLEPEAITIDPEHPLRFKIIAKANTDVYGWISKVVEKIGDRWQDAFLYGFYKHGAFRNKYPITFNVQSQMMRRVIKRKTEKNPRQEAYYRTVYGILDLEPVGNTLDFILSWLSSCKIQHKMVRQ
jgi:hypothetical protein